ncbi:helix-turn-helix domain-containing protein [Geobacillus sp. C56-T3]|uniref:helix-turn-helix domain-containing protein n=1 Tax=Geobacillus sp. (strain C56-T3) TaxID=691437 RepID=UPI0001D58730|nr:helix-turn-helix domain-containing protein [Geobacillus sp. C56-T3]ADI27594.1 putative two component transcriptional regulator, winged helix family [Geobacillus sp. C56-T3]
MGKKQEIERLREQLNQWLVEEEHDDDDQWLRRGEVIFQRFSQLEPENTKLKIWFAQLLRDYGRDIKLRKENYRKARKLFEQALRFDPGDPVCRYHWGHLELYDGRWKEAIRQFQLVLQSTSKHLEPYHYIRALCSSAIAYNQLGDPETALRLLDEAKKKDSERLYRTEIDNVRLQVNVRKKTDVEEEDPQFLLIEKNKHSYITYEEACKLAEEDDQYVILDMRRGAVLHGPCDSVELSDRLVKLLQCLLKVAPNVKEHDAIRTEVWGDGGDVRDDVVKKMMNKLRKKLKPCFSKPVTEIIVNVRGRGYRWECEIPYRIIVSRDDYEYII